MNAATLDAFTRLDTILRTLRVECPWDKVQTMQSLRYLTIEETYELSEAILGLTCDHDPKKADNELKKELGDLFMHLMFYAMIAEEEQRFDLGGVLNAISDKLVARHPFIYRKDEYHGEGWEQLKMHEGRKSVLEGVPASLPPLDKAVRMQEKAAGIGYKMPDCSDVARHVSTSLNKDMDEDAFGDLLFNLIHWAHSHGINADNALSRANRKFQDSVKAFETGKDL